MRPFVAFLTVCVAWRAHAQGTLTGHVRDSMGLGIADAEVFVAGGVLRAVTDAEGAFRLRGVPASAASVAIRRIGFRMATWDVVVSDGATADITVVLQLLPQQMPRVVVAEHQVALDPHLAGFRDRMQKRSGHFFTRDRIESLHATLFTDIFRGMASVHVGPVKGTNIRRGVRFRGSLCAPVVFIDGFAVAAAEFDFDMLDPVGVEAVEVYMDAATAPTELMGPRGGDRCGVIAIWSRSFTPTPRLPRQKGAIEELQRLLEASSVYSADQVDSTARIVPGTFVPVYPDSLWARAVEGNVRVEFVVDGGGAIEWQYFSVVSASNQAFTDAVITALDKATIEPAIKGRMKVRQVVQLPVRFERPKS
jgi:TonB family protein